MTVSLRGNASPSPKDLLIVNLPAQSNLSLDMNFPPADEDCSAIPNIRAVTSQTLDKMTKACGTRVHARVIAGFSALRANKAASIAAAGIAGIAAVGAISLSPSILPIGGILTVGKFAWDKLQRG
ncbi:MAG TPA: hypothetical protein VGO47_11360 [Chlamydiales bacterium]|nr:hypothetical protein [Chlamydiales bacterium]